MSELTDEQLHILNMSLCMPVRRRGDSSAFTHRIVMKDHDRITIGVIPEEQFLRGEYHPYETHDAAGWTVFE